MYMTLKTQFSDDGLTFRNILITNSKSNANKISFISQKRNGVPSKKIEKFITQIEKQ